MVSQEQQQISTKAGSVDYSSHEPESVNNIQEQAVDTEVSNQNGVQVRIYVDGGHDGRLGNQAEQNANLVEAQCLSDHAIDNHNESNRANDSNGGVDMLDLVERGIVFEGTGVNLVRNDGNASGQLESLIITDQRDGIVTFVRVKQEEMDASSPPFQNEYKAYIDCIFGGSVEISDAQEEQGLNQQRQVTESQVIYRLS